MQTKTNRFRSRYVTRVFNKSHFEMITRYTPRYDWPCAGYQWRGKLKINFYRVCASARLHTIDDNNNCLRPHTRTIGVFTKMVSDGFRTLISGRPSVRPSLARSSVNSRRWREDAHPGGRRPLSVVASAAAAADPGPPSCRRVIFRRSSPPRSTGGNAACRRARVMYLRVRIVQAGSGIVRGMRLVRWKRARWPLWCASRRDKTINDTRTVREKRRTYMDTYARSLDGPESFGRLLHVHRFRGVSFDDTAWPNSGWRAALGTDKAAPSPGK